MSTDYPDWGVTARAVRASDGDVKFVAVRCRALDGNPIANHNTAIALARPRIQAMQRKQLPDHELTDWSAAPVRR